ncbi:MAG: polyprenyl synthetase family protein [Treponema sp.]|jgi:octaprenyl-diphosphate synthase|nr:polyprenyl synthetase family protein [Treponema sp.]
MYYEYIQRIEKIEAVLRWGLPEDPDTSWLDRTFSDLGSPLSQDLVGSLTQPGWDLINRGGKRWRPLLMTLICESLGGGDGALPLTPLVEFSHNASLIHDDIEDNSDERRGQPAIHIRYGIDTAINGGSFLYFLSLACINAWDASVERKNQVFIRWGEHLRRLHLGQAMDIHWHRDFSSLPSLEEYDGMCRLKTGCLARLAAVLGVIAALAVLETVSPDKSSRLSKNEEFLIKTLGRAAEKLGVGFQILDDVKNLTTGNPGKKRGDDVVEGKKSLPVLLYLHRQTDGGALVARCFSAARAGGTAAPEVEELIGELTAAGVLQEAENQGQALITEARDLFSGMAPEGFPVCGEARNALAGLVDLMRGEQGLMY